MNIIKKGQVEEIQTALSDISIIKRLFDWH
jgi:hypothetical protein